MFTSRKVEKQIVIYVHELEYYSAVKGNELVIKATNWMNLKNIKLSKSSQIQRQRRFDSKYVKFKDWQNKRMVIKIRIMVASV